MALLWKEVKYFFWFFNMSHSKKAIYRPLKIIHLRTLSSLIHGNSFKNVRSDFFVALVPYYNVIGFLRKKRLSHPIPQHKTLLHEKSHLPDGSVPGAGDQQWTVSGENAGNITEINRNSIRNKEQVTNIRQHNKVATSTSSKVTFFSLQLVETLFITLPTAESRWQVFLMEAKMMR